MSMLTKTGLFVLLLTVAVGAGATEPEAAAAEPAETKTDEQIEKLSKAYELLSDYRHTEARKLIDQVIKTYKSRGDDEKLAAAYVVSTDYYRYVTHDSYRVNARKAKNNPGDAQPLPLHAVLGTNMAPRTKRESHRATDTYRKVIADAIAAKDHYKASRNYYGLAVHHFRSKQNKEGCEALDGTLAQYHLGREIDPEYFMDWDKMRYQSYAEQMNKTKAMMGCPSN